MEPHCIIRILIALMLVLEASKRMYGPPYLSFLLRLCSAVLVWG